MEEGEYTDDEDTNIETDIVDIEKMTGEKINQVAIDNILDQLEIIQKLLLYTTLSNEEQVPLVHQLVDQLNHIARKEDGCVPFLAEKIEEIMYDLCMEIQCDAYDRLQLRTPEPIPIIDSYQVTSHDHNVDQPIAYPVEQTIAYPVEQSVVYPVEQTIVYPVKQTISYPVKQTIAYPVEQTIHTSPYMIDAILETNTTIPCMTITHDVSFRDVEKTIPDAVETNTTIPSVSIPDTTFKQIQHQNQSLRNPCPIPSFLQKNTMTTVLQPIVKQKKRQKSPVPRHKRTKRHISHTKRRKILVPVT